MENRINVILTSIVLLMAGTYLLFTNWEAFSLRKNGEKVIGHIIEIPADCKRRGNEVLIEVDGKRSSFTINQADCLSNKYEVGQKLWFYQNPANGQVIKAPGNYNLEVIFVISVIIIIIAGVNFFRVFSHLSR